MAIRLICPNPLCGKSLTVKDEYAGRAGTCPACGTSVRVPLQSAKPRRMDPTAAPPSGAAESAGGSAWWADAVAPSPPPAPTRPKPSEPPPGRDSRSNPAPAAPPLDVQAFDVELIEAREQSAEVVEAIPVDPEPGPIGAAVLAGSPAGLGGLLRQKFAVHGLDKLNQNLVAVGLGALLLLVLAMMLPRSTTSVEALGIKQTPLLIETFSGALMLVMTLATLAFLLVAFFALARVPFQAAVATATGWGAFEIIWMILLAFVHDRANYTNSPVLQAFSGAVQVNTGSGIYVGLAAALGCLGAFGMMLYLQLFRRK